MKKLTKKDKINKLKNTLLVAYPTCYTMDIGIEYEVITSKGAGSGCCAFGEWPIYYVKIDEDISKLIENVKKGISITLKDFEDTYLEDLIKGEEDLKAFISFGKKKTNNLDFIYVLEQQWDVNEFYETKQEVQEAFIKSFGVLDQEWDEMDTDLIDYYYEQAEDYSWNPAFALLGSSDDDENEEEEEEKECDKDSEEEVIEDNSLSDKEKGEQLYNQALAKMRIGKITELEGANELLEKAVTLGNVDAMLKLGYNYMATGTAGVIHDSDKALYLWLDAAKLGNATAQYNVGVAYLYGNFPDNNKPDFKTSLKWLKKSAKQGFAEAIALIGKYHFYGYGIPQNFNKAYYWLNKGTKAGVGGIYLFLLGFCYEQGWGCKKNLKKAINCYEKSTEIPFSQKGLSRLKSIDY